MSGCKCNISLIIVLASLFSVQAFSQQINYPDSLAGYNSPKENLKPVLHYSVGSTFIAVPHLGSVTGFTLSPFLSVPLSPKLSVEGGIIAGRYYSTLGNVNPEGAMPGAFNELSLFGSASYHINSQLTLYGTGIKQLAGTSPFNILPKSSYTVGSTYNFGSFSIGVSLQMSKWNNNFGPLPVNSSPGFYSPYEPRPGTSAFGQ
ncbi:MAG: hypothetical protein ABR974_10010 [Bacteroidales bacterium]|jgi:hypothetical protein